MGKVRVKTISILRWPNKCEFCGDVSCAKAYASINNYGDLRYYFLWASWSRKTYHVSYPVCQKHKWLGSIVNKPKEFGFFNSLLVLALLPVLIIWATLFGIVEFFILPQQTSDSLIDFWITWAPALPLLYLLLCEFLKPVKLDQVSDSYAILSIRKKKYLAEFLALNKDVVQE